MFAVLTVFVHRLPATVLHNYSLCNVIVHFCRKYAGTVWRYAGAMQQYAGPAQQKKRALWSNMLALVGLGGSMLSLCRVILGVQTIRNVWSKCWPLIINAGPEHEDASHLHQYVQNDNMVL